MLPFLITARPLPAKENSRTNSANVTPPFSLSEHSASFHEDRSYDLPSLVELSLANNPYTRSAWFNALAAKASVGQAKAPYYPTLKFNASGGYSQMPYPTQTGPLKVNSTSISPGVALEYILLDFGRRAADVRNTTALLQAANLDFNRRMQTTLFAVQQSYFAHTAALSQQAAATSNLELSRTIVSMVEAQKNSGLATEPELLIARKTLSQAEFDLAAANRNAEVTLGNLRVAAGLRANAPLKVASPTSGFSMENLSAQVDQLITKAIANRPDLAAKEAEVRASAAATDRAKAEFLPKLSLEGTYNSYSFGYYAKQGPTAGTYFGNYNQMGGFAVLSWDLFDGFERMEKVKKRRAEESAARADAEATRLETTRDVWTSYQDSLKARKQVEYAASLLSSTKESFDSVNAAFSNGLATITDLVSSQSALANARFEQAGAEADYLVSLASLSLAMGEFTPPRSQSTGEGQTSRH
jgi:outer membrane protein TolC